MRDSPQPEARGAAHDRHFFGRCPCPPLRDRHPAARPLALALGRVVPDLHFIGQPVKPGGGSLVVAIQAAHAAAFRSWRELLRERRPNGLQVGRVSSAIVPDGPGAIGEIRGVTEFEMPPGPMDSLVSQTPRVRSRSAFPRLLS